MPSVFGYSISADFPAGFNADSFVSEIAESAIVTALSAISTSGDSVKIAFKSDLSASEITTLSGIVSGHDGRRPSTAPDGSAPTVATPNPGKGNADAIDMGGGVIVYAPAPGTGSHDVDTKSANPVASRGRGLWARDKLGAIVPASPPGSGDLDIMNVAMKPVFMIQSGAEGAWALIYDPSV